VDFEELSQLESPLGEPLEPVGYSRLLAELFAYYEFGIEQLQDSVDIGANRRFSPQVFLGAACFSGSQALTQLIAGPSQYRCVLRQRVPTDHRFVLSDLPDGSAAAS
jgi:hypothetical protein